jgi:methyl-accepting chemotaxis protein
MDVGAALESRADAEVDRSFEYALDALPSNAMFCDRELILRYLNRASRQTLLTLQEHLPVPVDQMVGKSIHIFHKSPQNIDRIFGVGRQQGAHHLPYKAIIALGPVKLDLNVEPMTGEDGQFAGAEAQRNDIDHLNGNLQMVATATHQIETSIAEIAKNAVDVSQAAGKSRTASGESKTAIESLRHPAAEWPR